MLHPICGVTNIVTLNIVKFIIYICTPFCFRNTMASLLKSAFVVGYTGATGKELVKELAKSKRFEKIVLIGRRKVEYDNEDLQNFVSKEMFILVCK